MQTALDTILTKSPETSITIQGDININLLTLNNTNPLYSFLLENNLTTTITTPTRQDPHHKTSTLIDVILTTLNETKVTSGTLSPPLSDHLQTYAIFYSKPERQKQTKRKTLSRRQYERQKDAIITNATTALTQLTPNTSTERRIREMQQTLQKTIEQYERFTKRRRKPWCSPKLASQIRKQHQLHQRKLAYPTPANIKKHKEFRHNLNKLIKHQKKQHIQSELEKYQKDHKQQAKILKTIIPSRSKPRTSPTEIIYEAKTHTDPQHIANALNDFFITVGHKTSETIPMNLTEEQIRPETPTTPTFQIKVVTIDQVKTVMKSLDRNKAADIYKISPALLKDLIEIIAPTLTDIFNQAILEQYYPDALKVTKVIEVYKSGNTNIPSNFRPISLLPIIAKIFDNLINQQIMNYLLSHNLISPTQYAFRPDSSTSIALQTIINDIERNRKSKQPTLAIYIDLSKAYDTVSHSKLLHKLKHNFNFSDESITFIASYFKNRQQTTHTQHAESTFQTITHGIPQGSTLSTTFFLIYINDIIKTVPSSKVYTYADDTTLIVTAPTLQALETLAQSELSSMLNYFYSNNLVPNAKKTVYSIFYPRTPQHLSLTISKTALEQEKQSKLLGIYMQKDLKHIATITHIIKKLQPILHSFRYATKFLPTHTMLSLYYSQVFPHLIYGITIWGSDNPQKTYLQPLIRTQKKIIRLIQNVPPRTHTKQIMQKLQILNIPKLFVFRVCVEMHPFVYPIAQPNRPNHAHSYLYTAQIHEHKTRYSTQQHQYIPNPYQYSRTRTAKHSMDHLTRYYSATWNSLPAEIRSIQNLPSFKTHLKTHLLRMQSIES